MKDSQVVLNVKPGKYSQVVSHETASLSGRVWPDGTFGYALVKNKGREAAISDGNHIDETGRDCSPPLGSSHLPNSHSSFRGKRGMAGITRYGGKMVRSAATLMQRKFGAKHLSFVTVTLPGLSGVELSEVCADWARIVRVFVQWYRRRLSRAGLPDAVVYVTEIQERRLRERGEVAPHLHLLAVGRLPYGSWEIAPWEVRGAWLRTIASTIGRTVESSAVENMEQVRSSAAGYLGKYMTKGRQAVAEASDAAPDAQMPTAWWGASQGLKRWVKAATISSEAAIEYLASVVQSGNHAGMGYCLPIEIGGELEATTRIGYAGRAKLPLHRDISYVAQTTTGWESGHLWCDDGKGGDDCPF